MRILEFIKENENWRDLLIHEPYRLRIKEYSPNENITFYKLNYHINPDYNLEIVRECRGVIIKEDKINKEYSIASRVFPKFFNYNEPIPEGEEKFDEDKILEYFFTKKLDGSMIHLWYDESMGWTYSSRGCIKANEAIMGNGVSLQDLINSFRKQSKFNEEEYLSKLDKDLTYIFELTSNENMVVVKHDKLDMTLIATYNNKTGSETCTIEALTRSLLYPNIVLDVRKNLQKILNIWSNDECLIAMKIDGDKIHRFKLKNLEYVRRAYLKSGYNDIRFKKFDIKWLDIIIKGEYEEFTSYFPEFKDNLDNTKLIYEDYKGFLKEFYNVIVKGLDLSNKKEVMLKMNSIRVNYRGLIRLMYLEEKDAFNFDEFLVKYKKVFFSSIEYYYEKDYRPCH